MDPEQAKAALVEAAEYEDAATVPASMLSKLTIADFPPGARLQVGTRKEQTIYSDWSGELFVERGQLIGEADHTWTRKYWYSPLGLEQYLDLVRRAVELRQRVRGDVEVVSYEDDGAYIHLRFRIRSIEHRLDNAYAAIRKVEEEIVETAEQAADEVGSRIAEVAARLSGWGSNNLDALVDAVDAAQSADQKGRALEELCVRLYSSVAGFSVTQRIRTETEEIDISIVNGSNEPRFSREGAVILVECKNWTARCGKNDFVTFLSKMANRSRRCSLGFLISWNGFTETVTKEMLRGSREEGLIVPLTGADIRAAVRNSDFAATLLKHWDASVAL